MGWSSGEYLTYHILRNNDTSASVWFPLSWQQPSLTSAYQGTSERRPAKGWVRRLDQDISQPEKKWVEIYLGRR